MKRVTLNDLAALDALDLLEEEERQAFTKARREQPALQQQVDELREASTQLALLAPPVAPPAALRQQLLERIKQLPQRSEVERITLAPGLFLLFSERMVWQETAIPGVKVKSLHVDPVRRYATSLVKMEPGAVYPAHHHQDIEELFMLDGDVIVSGHKIQSGDYCRAEPGTTHESIRTVGGCIFMAMASLDNAFVTG